MESTAAISRSIRWLPLQRLSTRASKACTNLIAYLQSEVSRSEMATKESEPR
jgi:hypothetical protein